MDRRYFDEYIGDAFYKGRVVRRLSQERFVEITNKLWLEKYEPKRKKGCSRSVYARYESGDVSMPIGFYKAGCDVLEMDWINLFEDATKYELDRLIEDGEFPKGG